MITATGINSRSFKNALAKAKRDADKGCYSFNENVENVAIGYYLTSDEIEALTVKLNEYYAKNYINKR